MQNYKMTIAYDGRKYKNFNVFKEDTDKTIQGKLEAILYKFYSQKIEVIGAINTDAGVHAKHQVVNFTVPNAKMNGDELKAYFEKYLTDDIIVLEIEAVDVRFHSRYNVKNATYQYRLWKNNAPNRPLFERHYVNLMVQDLDVSKMVKAGEQFIGTHDFSAFTTNKRVKNPIKEVLELKVEETSHEILISIKATGFILNMERLMVGTLIQIGLGQLPPNSIERALKTQDVKHVGHKASADALSLIELEF